jgi:hypothetical protein
MKLKQLPTRCRLNELFDYDADAGVLRWRLGNRRMKAGSIAGARRSDGYVYVGVDGVRYLAHRLIARMVADLDDDSLVDHRDGAGDNNRSCNLREAPNGQRDNCQNAGLSKANKTGYTGVFWDEARGCFQASIVVNRRKIHLGRHDAIDVAGAAYAAAKRQMHAFQPEVVERRA